MGHEARKINREAILKVVWSNATSLGVGNRSCMYREWPYGVYQIEGTLRLIEEEILEKEQCWRKVVVFSDLNIYFLTTFGIPLSPQKQFSSTRHHKQSTLDLRTNLLSICRPTLTDPKIKLQKDMQIKQFGDCLIQSYKDWRNALDFKQIYTNKAKIQVHTYLL